MTKQRVNSMLKRFSHNLVVNKLKPSTNNFWGKIALAPRDPIISINQLYQQDPNPNKINLSIGTYLTEENQSYLFSSVRKAEKMVFYNSINLSKEYSPMEGYHQFNQEAFKVLFDDIDKPNITVQTLAGTGALDLGAAFLGKFFEGRKEMYLSQPSWINHFLIFKNYQFNVQAFRYYDNVHKTFDTVGFFEDLEKVPENSVILFQPCGHNPSSVQPTIDQWKAVSRIARHKNLLPFFDIAYHGLCSGNIRNDVMPIRIFAEDGHLMMVSQSFSKNMGIYGDRVGSLTILCDSEEEVYRVRSQLKNIIISKYICPPSQGGRVVATLLQDRTLNNEWKAEVAEISCRLQAIRKQLRAKLDNACPGHSWQHITEQSGIFWYSGLSSAQVECLINEYSIYLCEDGRVNIAGINQNNIDKLVNVLRDIINIKHFSHN